MADDELELVARLERRPQRVEGRARGRLVLGQQLVRIELELVALCQYSLSTTLNPRALISRLASPIRNCIASPMVSE